MTHADPRSRLIEAALRILGAHGPSEIKARTVSTEAGLSTMGVYTHFGGVSELLQAVADEGFARQLVRFRQVTHTGDPMTNLCAIALACRDFALQHPHLYDLMFGLSIQGRYSPGRGSPTVEPKERSVSLQASYGHMRGECERMIQLGEVRQMDPDLMAAQLWSALHGFIMLELGAHFASIKDPVASILVPMCIDLVVGLGAQRDLAEASSKKAMSRGLAGDQPGAAPSRKRRSGGQAALRVHPKR